MTAKANVKVGVEVFLERHLGMVRSKRVGLITNPTGTDSNLTSTITLFADNPHIHLVALYGPEHGVRGDAQSGEGVPYQVDEQLKLPVFSLYSPSHAPEVEILRDIDAFMRTFDTVDSGKLLESSMVEKVDVLVFDIQDIGTRIYTYIATMAFAMQACAANNIEFILLDRPNPINGIDLEGPILEYPEYSSFVGLYPIPGELARLFNTNFLTKKAMLTVIPMEGWERHMWFDETGLPWIRPSPNMPSLETAKVYPGQVFIEGTNISEGRGTTKPFELFGAPWIDGFELSRTLNALDLAGVRFSEARFKPYFSKFQGEHCRGAQIHVTDRATYKPLETTLHIIRSIMSMNPGEFEFHGEYFDKIMGTAKVREALEENAEVNEILSQFDKVLKAFDDFRKPFLLY
jgi:uncharacterized protein YbbC (DUF1343 family)